MIAPHTTSVCTLKKAAFTSVKAIAAHVPRCLLRCQEDVAHETGASVPLPLTAPNCLASRSFPAASSMFPRAHLANNLELWHPSNTPLAFVPESASQIPRDSGHHAGSPPSKQRRPNWATWMNGIPIALIVLRSSVSLAGLKRSAFATLRDLQSLRLRYLHTLCARNFFSHRPAIARSSFVTTAAFCP